MRERELKAVLEEFNALPETERKPTLTIPADAAPPKRPLPPPPPGGLILKGYCTYVRRDDAGRIGRAKEFYYKNNPDRWPAETQSDMLWLTEAEWKSFVPADPAKGAKIDVPLPLQTRFFTTIGIDYMEGSVNALPARETLMTLTVESSSPESLRLRLDGHGKMGREIDDELRTKPNSRGCELRVMGFLTYNLAKRAFERFDIVGIGRAWGNKMDYVRREVRLDEPVWMYGIACELVQGTRPIDLIPPYNMLHYGSGLKYFPEK